MIQQQTEPLARDRLGRFSPGNAGRTAMGLFGPCGGGPPQRPRPEGMTRWSEDAAANGDAYYPDWMRQLNEVRQRAAQLIQAPSKEVALVPNTTAGIGLVAEGYPWKRGITPRCQTMSFPGTSTLG